MLSGCTVPVERAGMEQSKEDKMHSFTPQIIAASIVLVGVGATPSAAKALSQSEIRAVMLNKPLLTRRFGLSVSMVYRGNGTVAAKTVLGTSKGTWRYKGNKVCTTFPSGPAKGTSCASFTKTGKNRYRSSKGVNFRIGG